MASRQDYVGRAGVVAVKVDDNRWVMTPVSYSASNSLTYALEVDYTRRFVAQAPPIDCFLYDNYSDAAMAAITDDVNSAEYPNSPAACTKPNKKFRFKFAVAQCKYMYI